MFEALGACKERLHQQPESLPMLALAEKTLDEINAAIIRHRIKKVRNNYLDLGECGLTRIPQSIFEESEYASMWRDLKRLGLYDNTLCWLPSGISRCTNLKDLYLSKNWFEEVPEIVGQLSSLEVLHVDKNELKKAPTIAFNLPALRTLDARYNSFERTDDVQRLIDRFGKNSFDGNTRFKI